MVEQVAQGEMLNILTEENEVRLNGASSDALAWLEMYSRKLFPEYPPTSNLLLIMGNLIAKQLQMNMEHVLKDLDPDGHAIYLSIVNETVVEVEMRHGAEQVH